MHVRADQVIVKKFGFSNSDSSTNLMLMDPENLKIRDKRVPTITIDSEDEATNGMYFPIVYYTINN